MASERAATCWCREGQVKLEKAQAIAMSSSFSAASWHATRLVRYLSEAHLDRHSRLHPRELEGEAEGKQADQQHHDGVEDEQDALQ